MRMRDNEAHRIAGAILERLEKAQLLRITGKRADIESRIAAAFRKNMQEESDIEAEADRFAESHSRELVGMDRHRVVQLVKERIAKQRGFTL